MILISVMTWRMKLIMLVSIKGSFPQVTDKLQGGNLPAKFIQTSREGGQAHPAKEQVEEHLCGHQASVWWRAERPPARTLSVLWKMIALDEIAASSVFYRRIKSTVKFNCLIYYYQL